MKLQVHNVCFSYGVKKVVDDISLHVMKGEMIGIIGPNGSGKSTILKNIYRLLQPDNGNILLNDENLARIKPKQAAQKMAVVGQEHHIPFDYTVKDIVAMGRHPYKRLLDWDTPEDMRVIDDALRQVSMEHKRHANYTSLSGGEKQRIILARALAQQADFLILDEPTNHLDIQHQLQIFELMKQLDVTVLAAIHDLHLAALYCDRIYVMKEGKMVASGTTTEILTTDLIFDVFDVHCDIIQHPVTKRPSIHYLPKSVTKRKEKTDE